MSESSQFSQSPSRGLKNINKRMRRPKGGGAAMRRISLRNAGISIASTANKLKQQLSIALKNASTSIRSHQLSLVGRRWSAVVPFVEEDH